MNSTKLQNKSICKYSFKN